MDKQLWIGVLVGVAATILVLGGLLTAGATAMGMGGMDGMMDECRAMMEDHGHGHGDGGEHDHGGNGSSSSSDDGDTAHTAPAPAAIEAGDRTDTPI